MLIATIALVGCRITEPRSPTVTLEASIAATVLSPKDTLVVRRSVHNLGQEAVWLDLSSLTPSFAITSGNQQRACYLPAATAELRLRHISPHSTADEEQRMPLSRLTACPPGTYDVVVTAWIYRTENGPPLPAYFIRTAPQLLTITAP
jgi:hypothetical protein